MAGGAIKRGGGGRRGRGSYLPLSELNVTPIVDVMLVLLIVFMVTAPLLTVGVPVDLPQASASQLTDTKEPLTVSVNAKGEIYLQESVVQIEGLGPRLNEIVKNKADQIIYVRGDKVVDYGRVMQVMSVLVSSGFTKVSLVAEMPTTAPATTGRRR